MAYRTPPVSPGRTKLELDWKKVEFLLEAGSPGTEVAAALDVSFDTIQRNVERKFNKKFAQYAFEKRQKGESNLRAVQHSKALKGDNTMLLWLGKNRLKQRDIPIEDSFDELTVKQFQKLMDQISSVKSDLNKEDIKSNND